jgi:hypothetical protein
MPVRAIIPAGHANIPRPKSDADPWATHVHGHPPLRASSRERPSVIGVAASDSPVGARSWVWVRHAAPRDAVGGLKLSRPRSPRALHDLILPRPGSGRRSASDGVMRPGAPRSRRAPATSRRTVLRYDASRGDDFNLDSRRRCFCRDRIDAPRGTALGLEFGRSPAAPGGGHHAGTQEWKRGSRRAALIRS